MPQTKKKASRQKETIARSTPARHRRALLENTVGQAGRAMICGQVVDLPSLGKEIDKDFLPFHNLPISEKNKIRPIEDITMFSVRRAKLELLIMDITPDKFQWNSRKKYTVLHNSSPFQTKNNGFFAVPTSEFLAPGRYVVEIILKGITSLRQSLFDLRYLRNEDKSILHKNISIGFGKLTILAPDFEGLFLISDIDQTFIDTRFGTKEDLFRTLGEKPEEKQTLDLMPELYHQLLQSEEQQTLLVFLSSSPHFFRRTLTSFFTNHQIEVSGLYLKYLTGIIDQIGNKLLEFASHPMETFRQKRNKEGDLRDSLEEGLKFLTSHIFSLFDQVGYKLEMLLRNRLMQPTGAKEILIGDNSESDFFIYVLYQLLLKGTLSSQKLKDYLNQFSFMGREVLTSYVADAVCELTEKNLNTHGPTNCVIAVWINKSSQKKSRNQKFIDELILSSLSPELQGAYESDGPPMIIRPRLCEQGTGMALAAFDEGLLDTKKLRNIFQQKADHLPAVLKTFSFTKKTNYNSPEARQELRAHFKASS